MWKLIISFLFISSVCFGQLPTDIKYLELISEPKDTMVLINKVDVDKINSTYEECRRLDTLSQVRSIIIDSLISSNNTLEQIIDRQNTIISNSQEIQEELRAKTESIQKFYDDEKRKRKRDNIVWPTVAGAATVCLILTLLLN